MNVNDVKVNDVIKELKEMRKEINDMKKMKEENEFFKKQEMKMSEIQCSIEYMNTIFEELRTSNDDEKIVSIKLRQKQLEEKQVKLENEIVIERKEKRALSFFRYYFQELTHGHFMDKNDSRYNERRERVYTFLRQPFEIEKMMIYGWLLCFDVSLNAFTFLPLRILYAIMRIILSPIILLRGGICMDTALKCDLLKGGIFVISIYFMSLIDTSIIYHLVRAQTLIKLYIIYNMIEVADRLFSSFGQDILDALFFTVTESNRKKREFFRISLHFLLAVLYIFGHATLVLFQATTLNVAFNSHNKVLLTIMMANNFVEIKGTVFKKYDKNNLFQISCADVRERFHYFSLMLVVLLRNMQQYSWNWEHFTELVPNMLYVVICEHFIDWFKHAFVVKFNHIPIESYNEFRATLAYDVVSSRHKDDVASDHSDVVSRRLGFIPLPLAVLIFHVVRISVDFHGTSGIIVIVMGLIVVQLLKVLNSIVIVGLAVLYIEEDIKTQHQQQTSTDNKNTTATTKLSILDPFEQRGNRTIIVPKPLRVKTVTSARQQGGDGVVRANQKLVDSYNNMTTPAKERSMRPPSVDHIVTAGKCERLSPPTSSTTTDDDFIPMTSSHETSDVSTTSSSHQRQSSFAAATTRTKLDFGNRIEEENN